MKELYLLKIIGIVFLIISTLLFFFSIKMIKKARREKRVTDNLLFLILDIVATFVFAYIGIMYLFNPSKAIMLL